MTNWKTGLMVGTIRVAAVMVLGAAVVFADGQESELVGGLTLNDGNSENMQLNVGLATKGTYGQNEMKAGVAFNYGESTVDNDDGTSTDEKTTDNVKGDAQYNRLFNERTYGNVLASALTDDIADIDYRTIVGLGLGQYLVKSDTRMLALEAGPAYLFEKVGGEENDTALLRVAQRAEQKFANGAKIWESVEYLPEVEDFGAYLLNAEAGVDAAINSAMSLRVVVQDRYDSEPAPGSEENDLSITAGLVYKL